MLIKFIYRTGKGIIATRFSSGGITFEFSELSRHMDDGSVWTTDNISSITTDSISNKVLFYKILFVYLLTCLYRAFTLRRELIGRRLVSISFKQLK